MNWHIAGSNMGVASTSTTVPGAPTIGAATRGNASASVAFTAPASNGGAAITGYTVTSSPGGLTGTGGSSPITVSGLTNGTAYTFTVTATNSVGTSAASGSSSSVTPATTPGAPTIGTATAGSLSATVAFTAPASTGGSAITGYTATSSPGGFTGTGSSSPITVAGLTASTAYTFTVTATNAVGTGTASAASNSATPTSSAITHGDQITTSNTGYGAYFDSGLGRNVILSDLVTTSGTHLVSDYVSAGGTLTKRNFTGDLIIDVNNVTIRACKFANEVFNYNGGVHHTGTLFDYCSFDTTVVGDEAIAHQSYSANRCYIRGFSDGLKAHGGGSTQEIVECYIRVKMANASDHNDGIQSIGPSGALNIRRCNISVNPEGGLINGGASGGPNGLIMSADWDTGDDNSGVNWHLSVIDCLLDGTNSNFTLRFYDGGLSTGILYTATGNKHVRPGAAGNEVHRGGNAIETPTGQITWSNNRWADDLSTITLS